MRSSAAQGVGASEASVTRALAPIALLIIAAVLVAVDELRERRSDELAQARVDELASVIDLVDSPDQLSSVGLASDVTVWDRSGAEPALVLGPDVEEPSGSQAERVSASGGDRVVVASNSPSGRWQVGISREWVAFPRPLQVAALAAAFVALVAVALLGLVGWLRRSRPVDDSGEVADTTPPTIDLIERLVDRPPYRSDLEGDDPFRGALRSGQMRIDLQPVVELDTHAIVAVEALVRWEHRDHGPLSGRAVVEHAHAADAVLALDRWVVGAACDELSAWREVGGTSLPDLSINLSAAYLTQPDGVQGLIDTVEASGWQLEQLVVEVREQELRSLRVELDGPLRQLRSAGVRVAIDDLDAGSTLLARLDQVPVDVVKLDRSVVRRAGTGDQAALVGLVARAERAGCDLVAEGIENRAEVTAVVAAGVRLGQGNLLGRPAPAIALSGRIGDRPSDERRS